MDLLAQFAPVCLALGVFLIYQGVMNMTATFAVGFADLVHTGWTAGWPKIIAGGILCGVAMLSSDIARAGSEREQRSETREAPPAPTPTPTASASPGGAIAQPPESGSRGGEMNGGLVIWLVSASGCQTSNGATQGDGHLLVERGDTRRTVPR